jgi:hypothetical protein
VFFAQGAIEVPSGTWTVDSVHSVASFAVRHMMVGTFREFSEIDATLTDGKLIGQVKVMTDWAGLRCASLRSQPMVGQRPNLDCARSTSGEPPRRAVGATATRRSRKPTSMQKCTLLVPRDDQRRLLSPDCRSSASTNSRLSPAAVRRPGIRQTRDRDRRRAPMQSPDSARRRVCPAFGDLRGSAWGRIVVVRSAWPILSVSSRRQVAPPLLAGDWLVWNARREPAIGRQGSTSRRQGRRHHRSGGCASAGPCLSWCRRGWARGRAGWPPTLESTGRQWWALTSRRR